MRGTSLRSLSEVQERFAPVLAAAGDDSALLGEHLFAVLDALDSSKSLERAIADPSRSSPAKVALVRSLLVDTVDPRVVSVIEAIAEQRWVADQDVADAVERIAVETTLHAAEERGQLLVVEDELFTIVRALIDSKEVREVLSDPVVNVESRVRLLEAVLAGRGDRISRLLAVRATLTPRGRRFSAILGWYGDIAAEMRNRTVAAVTTGSKFTEKQLQRLESLLGEAYGRQIQMNVNVDPEIIGGLRIQVGAEVMDATVLTRLVDAKRRLAG